MTLHNYYFEEFVKRSKNLAAICELLLIEKLLICTLLRKLLKNILEALTSGINKNTWLTAGYSKQSLRPFF